jgi:hypothetical protein
MPVVKQHNPGKLNVFLSQEGDEHFANLLEFNVMADGKSPQEAFNNLLPMIIDYLEFFVKANRLQDIYNPAPSEYWDLLNYWRLKRHQEPVIPRVPEGIAKVKTVNRIKKYLDVYPPQENSDPA